MITPITITVDNQTCREYLMWWRNGWQYYSFNKGGQSCDYLGENFNWRLSDKQSLGFKDKSEDVAAGLRGLLFSKEVYYYDNGWLPCNIADGSLSVNDGVNGVEAEITVIR